VHLFEKIPGKFNNTDASNKTKYNVLLREDVMPQINEESYLEEDDYTLVCNRSQLNEYTSLPFGIYYVDIEYVFRVSSVPSICANVEQFGQQLCMKLVDIPTYECCFVVGGLVGGKKRHEDNHAKLMHELLLEHHKKKKHHKKKHNNIPGVEGHGRFNIGNIFKSIGRVARPILMDTAMGAKKAAIASTIKTLQGHGAYSTRSGFSGRGSYNSLINPTGPPIHIAHSNDETGSITLTYSEYLRDVFSNGTSFQNLGISINPGLSWAPFLSQIAQNYKLYKFEQLIFRYVPTVANVTATGQLGTVIMALDYNSGDSLFTNKVTMMGYSGAINAIISDNIAMGVECDEKKGLEGFKYIRGGAVPSGQDIKTYDKGLLQIATSGINPTSFPSGTQIGELHVEYKVRLFTPSISQTAGLNNDVDTFIANTSIATSNLFGTSPQKSVTNYIGGTVSKSGIATYTFPDNTIGAFTVIFTCTGTGFLSRPSFGASGNLTFLTAAYNGSFAFTDGAASTTNVYMVIYVNLSPASTSGGNFITVSGTGFTASTITSSQLVVEPFTPLAGVSITQYTPA
jgi:hypothetical protein